MRERKVKIVNEVQMLIKKLRNINAELPEKMTKPLPEMPVIDDDVEFPDKNLEV